MSAQMFEQLAANAVSVIRQHQVNVAIGEANAAAWEWRRHSAEWQAYARRLEASIENWRAHTTGLGRQITELNGQIDALTKKVQEIDWVKPYLIEGLIARVALNRVRREIPIGIDETTAETIGAIESDARLSCLPVLERFGFAYIGDCKDGKRHGTGSMRTNSGIYEGEWKNDQMSGFGAFIFSNGEKYEGEFQDGNRHGKGLMRMNSSTYDGEWKNDQMCGFGVLSRSNGEKYEGDFRDGKFHGKGLLRTTSSTYDGEWKDGHKSGFGVYIEDDVLKYEGEFHEDQYCGSGTMTLPNGDQFSGEWAPNVNDKGQLVCGTYLRKRDGLLFEGKFRDGLPGRGILRCYLWTWEGDLAPSGNPDGYGKLIFCDGSVRTGTVAEGRPVGQGCMSWPNGDQFRGDWGSADEYRKRMRGEIAQALDRPEETLVRWWAIEIAKGTLIPSNGRKKWGKLMGGVFKESLISRLFGTLARACGFVLARILAVQPLPRIPGPRAHAHDVKGSPNFPSCVK